MAATKRVFCLQVPQGRARPIYSRGVEVTVLLHVGKVLLPYCRDDGSYRLFRGRNPSCYCKGVVVEDSVHPTTLVAVPIEVRERMWIFFLVFAL